MVPAPNNPVTLIGGVLVFCDPGTTLSIPLMDGRWKVAVGLHPKSFNHDDAYLDQVRTLVQSNPLVAALGEIGLDRTVPDYLWDEQERTFQRLLTFCHPDKVLVLHLRGIQKYTRRMFLIPAFKMFGKPVPGTRKSICIVLLVDVLM